MYASSAELIATVRTRSWTRANRLEWLDSSTLAVKQDLSGLLVGGSVTVRANNEIRRTCSLHIANAGGANTPQGTSDPFFLNNVLRVSMGVVLPSTGLTEWVPLGTFMVDKPDDDAAAASHELIVDGTDFWKRLKYAGLGTNAHYAAGSPLGGVFADLAARAGILNPSIDASADTMLLYPGAADLVLERGLKVADALTMVGVDDFGFNPYFDQLGAFFVKPSPDYSGAAVYAFADTDPSFVRIHGGFEDSPDINNHVIVSSANNDVNPIVAECWDDDSASSTYRYGPFGDRLIEYKGDAIQTIGQAEVACYSILRRSLLYVRRYDVTTAPLPFLDAHDVVTVTSAEKKLSAMRGYIESITLPLDGTAMVTRVLEVKRLGLS